MFADNKTMRTEYDIQREKAYEVRKEANSLRICGNCKFWLGDRNDSKHVGKCIVLNPTKRDPLTQLVEEFDGKTRRSFSCKTQFEKNENIHFENGIYHFKNLTK